MRIRDDGFIAHDLGQALAARSAAFDVSARSGTFELPATPRARPRARSLPTRRPWLQRGLEAIVAFARRTTAELALRRHVEALRRLDDATLRDLGLSRSDIGHYASLHHPVARNRFSTEPWFQSEASHIELRTILRDMDLYR